MTGTLDEAVGRILRDWDPIGIGKASEAHNEYMQYIGETVALLERRASAENIFELLWEFETEHMGLPGNEARTRAIAARLAALAK